MSENSQSQPLAPLMVSPEALAFSIMQTLKVTPMQAAQAVAVALAYDANPFTAVGFDEEAYAIVLEHQIIDQVARLTQRAMDIYSEKVRGAYQKVGVDLPSDLKKHLDGECGCGHTD